MARLHRFPLENQCYHVATSTWRRELIFAKRDNALAVVSALQFVRRERAFVLAYAVMPDHLHVLVVPKEGYDILV